jgi:hypothetical protein
VASCGAASSHCPETAAARGPRTAARHPRRPSRPAMCSRPGARPGSAAGPGRPVAGDRRAPVVPQAGQSRQAGVHAGRVPADQAVRARRHLAVALLPRRRHVRDPRCPRAGDATARRRGLVPGRQVPMRPGDHRNRHVHDRDPLRRRDRVPDASPVRLDGAARPTRASRSPSRRSWHPRCRPAAAKSRGSATWTSNVPFWRPGAEIPGHIHAAQARPRAPGPAPHFGPEVLDPLRRRCGRRDQLRPDAARLPDRRYRYFSGNLRQALAPSCASLQWKRTHLR